MLDQSFSAENFRRIFDDETRKGVDIAGMFFPDLVSINQQLKNTRLLIKTDKLNKISHYDTLKSQLAIKEETLKKIFDDLADRATPVKGKIYEVLIEKDTTIGDKPVYKLGNDDVSFFIIKLIQKFIRKLYKVKQADRHQIVSQLYLILADNFPKKILRTDIQEFYESIPQSELLKIIDKENLLSHTCKLHIKQIIDDYNILSGSDKGLPRGIGVSAYLAELFMRDIDRKIREDEEIIFFARYVDDIVIIYAPKPDSNKDNLTIIKSIIENHGLAINAAKTNGPKLVPDQNLQFDYLGYEFKINNKKLTIDISNKKRDKYIRRIQISFSRFANASSTQRNLAKKLLINRLKFLSQNTKLSGRKENTLIGIYFSNRLLFSPTKKIKGLDFYLQSEIDKLKSPRLQTILRKLSFEKGFDDKTFFKTTPLELKAIAKAWR